MDQPPPVHVIPFGPDGNCTLALCPIEKSVYRYRPSLVANAVFIALYSLAMLVHIVLGVRWKAWWFMWCMIAGCVDEIIGYVGRVLMYYNPFNFTAFMMQIVCVTTGPVFYCAAIYVTLAQTINHISPTLARFSPKFLYWVFIPCDVVSLVLQGAGGALSTTSKGSSQTGINLALAGLSFQVFTLVFFGGFFSDYLVRLARSGNRLDTRMIAFLAFLGTAFLLTLARCIFRVDELSEGYSGPLVADEGLFIGLEGVLIVVSVFALCIGHPGLVFSHASNRETLSKSSA